MSCKSRLTVRFCHLLLRGTSQNRLSQRLAVRRRKVVEKIKAHHGAVPYGWQRDLYGRLVELVEEQQNIEQMRRYRAGGETLRSIKSGMGLRLSLATIARICSAKQDEVGG